MRDIYYLLRERGLDAWYEQEKIIAGEHWRQKAIAAVEKSDFVCLYLSTISVAKDGFVQKEIRVVIRRYQETFPASNFLLPVKLDACDASSVRLDDNTTLADIQYIEAMGDARVAVDKLSRAIWRHWYSHKERGEG